MSTIEVLSNQMTFNTAAVDRSNLTRPTDLDLQSDRNIRDIYYDTPETKASRSRYSAFYRWEQRVIEWKMDLDAIRKWCGQEDEPITTNPPEVSFTTVTTCRDCQDRSHEVCCHLRRYQGAVDDVKVSLMESEVMNNDTLEETQVIDGVESPKSKLATRRDDDDDETKVTKTTTELALVVVKEAEGMLALAQEILNQFNSIFLTLVDIGSYQNQQDYVSFDSNPIATNPGVIPFCELIPPPALNVTASTTASSYTTSVAATSKANSTAPLVHNSTSPVHNPALLPFQSFLQELFQHTKDIDQTDESCFEKLQQTATLILQWTPTSKPFAPNAVYYTPSETVTNSHLSQMILFAIIFKTASILGRDTGLSRHQQQQAASTTTPPLQVVVNHVAERLTEVIAHSHAIPAKMESLVDISSFAVPEINVKRVLNELADNFLEALQFGGLGINRKYRGAILTAVSVEVFELELVNVGTTRAQLLFRRSGAYPLLDEATIVRLLKVDDSIAVDSLVIKLKTVLVDADPTKGLEILVSLISYSDFARSGVPEGTIAFVNTEAPAAANGPIDFVGYLGSRQHHNLYKLPVGDVYLKVPKTHRYLDQLQKELTTLRALDHPYIAKVHAQGLDHLKVSIRGESSEFRCVRMEGLVGIDTWGFAFRDLAALSVVCERVMDALKHAHSRSIVHLNVSPRTITVRQVTRDVIQVQLDEWGSATTMDVLHYSYQGLYSFSHSELHDLLPGQSWSATAEHDLASLAYCMGMLVSLLEMRRKPIMETKVNRNMSFVEAQLTKLNLNSALRKRLMDSLRPVKKNLDRRMKLLKQPNYTFGFGNYMF